MGLLDRTRAALRPANSIEAAPAPERPAPRLAADPPPPAPAPAAPERRALARKAGGLAADPEAITKSYFTEDRGGERRYYDDYQRQALAMRATATAIRSKREDLGTIQAMLTLAEARSWTALEVKGSATFRREAWIEAQARGIEARGHRPSEPDRQEVERRSAARDRDNRVQAPVTAPAPPAPSRAAPAPAVPQERPPARTEQKPASPPGDRPAARRTADALSPEGRLVLAALSGKIDRQLTRQGARAQAELKAFVAAEMLKREQAVGPVELSPAQRRAATASAPARDAPGAEPRRRWEDARSAPPPPSLAPATARRSEPEAPRRGLGR